ncbi:MAG: DUF1858 domain-containing protein [Bacteroidota bacterium]
MPVAITGDTPILAILEEYPETRAVFIELGMGCPECLGAGMETVETGARMHGLDVRAVLAALARAIGADGPSPEPARGPQQE